jgi:c-di-GMP-binding flagellar brake protein YcgR
MAEYGSATFDRRQFPRLDCSLPFAYEIAEQKRPEGLTANVSLGGLLVNLPQPVEIGTVMELNMHLPSGEGDQMFKVRGEVVWVSTENIPEGWSCQAGVRFFEMSLYSFKAWKGFLQEYFKK